MKQAAGKLNVHKLTLYRWEKRWKVTGEVPLPDRYERKNERVYTDEYIEVIRAWKDKLISPSQNAAT